MSKRTPQIFLPILFFLAFWGLTSLHAQEKYWVFFTDKGENLSWCAEDLLSPASLQRRAAQGIPIDQRDYPLYSPYLDSLRAKGAELQVSSRWLNAVSANLDLEVRHAVAMLTFVKEIRPVSTGFAAERQIEDPTEDYDTHRIQLSLMGVDDLHAYGYTGKGRIIAVIDNGFLNADLQAGFAHLFEEGRVLATRDFVEPGHDVFAPCRGSCRHGAAVLSTMAARLPGELMGAAPDAQYMLFRTENDTSETHQEEDYWVAAAELADSLGAHIINSSLGYFSFDEGEGDYGFGDLDGKTTIVSRGASIAAAKGILVVNSAGNEGWRGIIAPADADSILAVGALTQEAERSSFSSVGPSADGRIKPDVVAMGQGVYHLTSEGDVRPGNGTSYASPLTAGLAACLWQAAGEDASAQEIRNAIIRSADRYENPDNWYGYGLPQGRTAFTLLTGEEMAPIPSRNQFATRELLIYPNPASDRCWVGLGPEATSASIQVGLFDLMGRRVQNFSYEVNAEYNAIEVHLPVQNGLYLLRVWEEGEGRIYAGKVLKWE